MKNIKLFVTLILILTLTSCHKAGKISIQNKISKVTIQEVKWGDIYIANELLPGKTSDVRKIYWDEQKLPCENKVSFTMVVNDKSIYLETDKKYLLNEDDNLLIVLEDTTKVSNPNE